MKLGKTRLLVAVAAGVLVLAFTVAGVGAQAAPAGQATPGAGTLCPMGNAGGSGPFGANGAGAGAGLRGGMMGGAGWGMNGAYGDADIATLLGMSASEISTERQAGKSLVELAATKNVGEDTLIQTILADRKAQLDDLVQANRLTQVQADAMLANMQTNVKTMVERTTVGPAGSPRLGNGQTNPQAPRQGMGPGWQNQNDNQPTTPQRTGPGMGRFGMNRG